MRYTTLCLLHKDDQILLAMKKRGFGVGRWNGVGGKVGPDETIEQSVIREAFEEIGVKISPENLNRVAIHNFSFLNKPEWDQEVHVFFVDKWEGEPIESEEMKPQWYLKNEIPYDLMWEDDRHWLPKVIAGEKVKCSFSFDENQKLLDGFTIETLIE